MIVQEANGGYKPVHSGPSGVLLYPWKPGGGGNHWLVLVWIIFPVWTCCGRGGGTIGGWAGGMHWGIGAAA